MENLIFFAPRRFEIPPSPRSDGFIPVSESTQTVMLCQSSVLAAAAGTASTDDDLGLMVRMQASLPEKTENKGRCLAVQRSWGFVHRQTFVRAAEDTSFQVKPTRMFRDTKTVSLRGEPFVLSVSGSIDHRPTPFPIGGNDTISEGAYLDVSIRSERSGQLWSGSFTDQYVENISKKTGNFKRFPVFVEMLMSALVESGGVVALDLLTPADVESLKQRQEEAKQIRLPPTKVYLILTYASAFDRVHYPLPLSLQQAGGSSALSKEHTTVERLKIEVEKLELEKTKLLGEIAKLTKENDRLRHEQKSDLEFSRLAMYDMDERLKRQLEIFLRDASLKRFGPNSEEFVRSLGKLAAVVNRVMIESSKSRRQSGSRVRSTQQKRSSSVNSGNGSRNSSVESTRRSRAPLPPKGSPSARKVASKSRDRSNSLPRFDPTRYVHERQARAEQIATARMSRQPRSRSNSRNASIGSRDSSFASVGSTSFGMSADDPKFQNLNRRIPLSLDGTVRQAAKKVRSPSRGRNADARPSRNRRSEREPLSLEDNGVDERLRALQQYLSQIQLDC